MKEQKQVKEALQIPRPIVNTTSLYIDDSNTSASAYANSEVVPRL